MFAIASVLFLAAQLEDPFAKGGAKSGRAQVFIAPSGEPFRTYGDEPYPSAKWFAEADKNGDGKLDYAEFEADFLRFFAALDTDHDGVVDGIERAHYENVIAPETISGAWDERFEETADDRKIDFGGSDQGASTVSRPKPSYATMDGAAQYDLLGLPEPVAAMDERVSGRIRLSDAKAAARRRFDMLDRGKLGYLTFDTLPQTYAELRGGGKKRRKR